MKIVNREIFKNNKITESICQFTFQKQIDASVIESIKAEFQSKGIYTESIPIPFIRFNFNLNKQTQEQINTTGFRIFNSNKDKAVQIQVDNISVHQIGHYERWELFKEDINNVLSIISPLITSYITRIDQRVINIFDLPEDANPSEYFNVYVNNPFESNSPYNYNLTFEQTYEPNVRYGVIKCNCRHQNNNTRKVLFDLNSIRLFINSPIVISDNKTDETLEMGHQVLYDLFDKSITEKTRNLIR